MKSLFFRNLLFTILQPGIVAGLIPYFIVRRQWLFRHYRLDFQGILGTAVFTVGLILMGYCIYLFATRGKGTLSPFDRTKNLVVQDVYRFSRNPMYVGVILILIGEALITGSLEMLVYTVIVFFLFHAFILFIEEPRLKRDFGPDYELYLKKTRRWL